MKIISNLKNTKADKQIKQNNLLAANNRQVIYNGMRYIVHVAKVGPMTLADAEPVRINSQHQKVNLFSKTVAAQSIKNMVENGLFS